METSPNALSARSNRGTQVRPGTIRLLFLALLGCWMVFPFMQIGVLAEDAVPFIAAARVQGPASSIYSSDLNREVPTALRDAGCPLTPSGTDCDSYVLPFLSPPQVLPVMSVISHLGDNLSVLFMRLVAAGGFAGGMWFLWTAVTRERSEAEFPLAFAAVFLTPFVYHSTAFGQNSPLLFLSACLGLSKTDRGGRAFGAATVWVATVLFKLFPLPLILVAMVRRKWRFVAWSVGLLVLLTLISLPLVPSGSFGDFLQSSRVLTANRVTSPWNVSIDSFIHVFDPSWRGEGRAFYAVVVARLLLIGGLFWWKLRDADEDQQWSYAWVALLALHPQIWWHYFEIMIPAVVFALRNRRGMIWYAVPAAAALLVPMAVVTDESTLRWYGPVLIIAATLGIPFLRSAPAEASPAVRATPSTSAPAVSAP